MAKTYKELVNEMAKRGLENTSGIASDFVDSVVNMPANTVEKIQNIKQTMKTKSEVVATTLEAKLLIQDKLLEDVDDAAFAYKLATDETLRNTVNQITQEVLQPTPVSVNANVHSNAFIDLGAGLSTFWTEMQKKTPIELETAMKIENVIMNINAGLDDDMEPDTRKLFLKEAGMTEEQVKELVPIQAYVEYEDRCKENVRAQVRKELGITGEPTEEEQLMIDSMTEDRIMGTKLQMDMNDVRKNTMTYEDIYSISAQDMYDMFADKDQIPDNVPVPESGEHIPIDDAEWAMLMEMGNVEEAYAEVIDNSMEANLNMLAELESAERSDLKLTEDDLAFSQAGYPNLSISEEDLAFAEQYANVDSFEQ